MHRSLIAASTCLLIASAVRGQRGAAVIADRAWADSTLHALVQNKERDGKHTVEVTARMLTIYARDRDSCKLALVSTYRSTSFDQLGELDSAMAAMQHAFTWFRPACDSVILARAYLSQSNLLISLSDLHRADSICAIGLGFWNPAWKHTAVRNALYTNQAIARAMLGDMIGAMRSFRMVLGLARKENNPQDIDDALTNIGALKSMLGELDSSDYYYHQALIAARSKGNTSSIIKQLMNLGENQSTRGNHRAAITLLDSALFYSRVTGDMREQRWIEDLLSGAYTALGEHAEANVHLRRYLQLNDTMLNIEKVRSLTEMQEKYESEKKAKEILGLRAENLEGELVQASVKRTRNIYLFSAIGVVGLAIGLWSRLRYVHRSRAAIQKEKDVSEGLLLNILPEEVAAELKAKGFADAKEFDIATILFSDFKGFTELSEKLTADELIKELNVCFKAFDGIMGEHHIEKIKTIGDAYMAAGGLPDSTKGSPADVVMAALDMQSFMRTYATEREAEKRPHFTMRVGLHTGPVIAGIVGVKKFAYDIWGDTVNTASRMESSGEVGRVNISHTTYLLVKDDARFTFTSRGMVAAKGKGEIEMWFAERKR